MTNEQLAEYIQMGDNDELLPLLWDKTRDLIYMKCGQYWTFYAAKLERHGYSLEYTYQLRNKALRKLRNNMQLRRIYGADYGFHSTARHKSLAAFLTSGTSGVEDYVMQRLVNCAISCTK